jgi:transposase
MQLPQGKILLPVAARRFGMLPPAIRRSKRPRLHQDGALIRGALKGDDCPPKSIIEGAGASLRRLLPYSSDFNPIEGLREVQGLTAQSRTNVKTIATLRDRMQSDRSC